MKASETLRAPAKLNLTLEVLAQRPDGLHGIRSVMVPVDLCDELHVSRGRDFQFTCDAPEFSQDNLVERALSALGLQNSRVQVTLQKRIPAGAGLGGGSSDAATVLLAAQRGTLDPLPALDYMAIARSLGSDVPFFLAQTAALVEGTGERVTALGAIPHWHAVIVRPPVSVSTAWAYREIDKSERPTRPRNSSVSLEMAEALQRAEFERVVSLLQNDFQDVLLRATPEIATALDALRSEGASRPLLTGSGSCVFALAQTEQERDAIASSVRLPEDYHVYTCSFWSGEAWRSAA